MEPTPAAPPPGNDYNFIMNPEKAKKKVAVGGFGGDPFIAKVVLLVGGALALIVVLAIAVNLFFGGKSNIDVVVGIAQREQEIIRLSGEGDTALGQEVKNAALNTRLSVKSHQQSWVAFLSKRGRVVPPEEMNLKKDTKTDDKLKLAEETSTFDTTYTTVMVSQLENYAGLLKTAYSSTGSKTERELLSAQYNEVQLLLDQWPSSTTVGFASH